MKATFTLTAYADERFLDFDIVKEWSDGAKTIYRTEEFSEDEFQEMENNTENDWKNYLKTSGSYHEVKDLDERKVDKSDYEIYDYMSGYHGICPDGSHGGDPILGGDSANEDDYNREYFEEVYKNWDGVLVRDYPGSNWHIEL